MKPYQLSGLSYLLWLYKNGASGILGDEMGLGKTLVRFAFLPLSKADARLTSQSKPCRSSRI